MSAAILKKPKVVFSPRLKTRDTVERVQLSVASPKGKATAGTAEVTPDNPLP